VWERGERGVVEVVVDEVGLDGLDVVEGLDMFVRLRESFVLFICWREESLAVGERSERRWYGVAPPQLACDKAEAEAEAEQANQTTGRIKPRSARKLS
jgi:hypothetical protein